MTQFNDTQQHLLSDFTEILGKEVALYGELEEVLKNKQFAIIEGKVERLQDTIHLEHGVVQKIRRSTHSRELQAGLISDYYKLGGQNPPLREIITIAPEESRVILTDLQLRLKDNLKNIEFFNKENDYLLNSSLETIRGLINILLSSGGEGEVVYNGRGTVANANGGRSTVDCQI